MRQVKKIKCRALNHILLSSKEKKQMADEKCGPQFEPTEIFQGKLTTGQILKLLC